MYGTGGMAPPQSSASLQIPADRGDGKQTGDMKEGTTLSTNIQGSFLVSRDKFQFGKLAKCCQKGRNTKETM